MLLEGFLGEKYNTVKTVISPDFDVEIVATNFVPDLDDSSLTYANSDSGKIRCKSLESCVLYVDIRKSTNLNQIKHPENLVKVYSSFIRSMIEAARKYDGHVRNIIGDRVMVVFDRDRCFSNAVETAILMNTISHQIISPQIRGFEFRCGIGIDYGKMLITKAGMTRHGAETEFYRSLVWLGRPANIASKLTDVANTIKTTHGDVVQEGYYYPPPESSWLSWKQPSEGQWRWVPKTYDQFLDSLESTYSSTLKHKDPNFVSFFKTTAIPDTKSIPPILMTDTVFSGFKSENPAHNSLRQRSWYKQPEGITAYTGIVCGGDVLNPVVKGI